MKRAVSDFRTTKDTDIEFPKIKYFQTKKVNLADNLIDMISSQKENKKKQMISDDLKNDIGYRYFKKDSKNPAIGPNYIKDKYSSYYDKFFVSYYLKSI